MNRMIIRLATVAAVVLLPGLSVQADDQQARDGRRGVTADGEAEPQQPDPKAQSGAEAADEARIYTAQLRKCESLRAGQREACVDAAKRRLGQL